MRMWQVEPRWLCKQHLLGEHYETHMFVGTIIKGTSLQGYIDNELLEVHTLEDRHEQLAAELQQRGMQHNSPLRPFMPWTEGNINRNNASAELFRRCIYCTVQAMNDLCERLQMPTKDQEGVVA